MKYASQKANETIPQSHNDYHALWLTGHILVRYRPNDALFFKSHQGIHQNKPEDEESILCTNQRHLQ